MYSLIFSDDVLDIYQVKKHIPSTDKINGNVLLKYMKYVAFDAYENEYYIYGNTNLGYTRKYFIDLVIQHTKINDTVTFQLYSSSDYKIAYCSHTYYIQYYNGNVYLSNMTSEKLKKQQYKMIKKRTKMIDEGLLMDLDKKYTSVIFHCRDFFKKEYALLFGL